MVIEFSLSALLINAALLLYIQLDFFALRDVLL